MENSRGDVDRNLRRRMMFIVVLFILILAVLEMTLIRGDPAWVGKLLAVLVFTTVAGYLIKFIVTLLKNFFGQSDDS